MATDNSNALRELASLITPNVELEITIKQARQKRSINANNFAWELITKLAKAQGITPIEVYKQQVQNMYTYSRELIEVLKFQSSKEEWERDHTGRLLEPIGVSEQHPEYLWVKRYKGTSDYDSREMSHFIDLIVMECENLGIRVDQSESNKAKESWKK